MQRNLFYLDNQLIADIDNLLKFLRQPIPLDEVFQKIPDEILNAKLNTLEFKPKNNGNEYFVIKFKNINNPDKAKLTNKDLSPLGITTTGKIPLYQPLIDSQKDSPKSNLKDHLTYLIKKHDNKIKKLQIEHVLKHINNKDPGKNKQKERNLLFKYLEKLLAQESFCENFISITSEVLLAMANNLSLLELQYPNFNFIISEIHTNLDKPKLDTLSISKNLLAYEKLFYNFALIFPVFKKAEIHFLIDLLVRIESGSLSIISNYQFFKLSYFGQKGFQYTFGGEDNIDLYDLIQASCKNFSSYKKNYLEITHLIQKLYILANNNQKIIDLSKELNHLTDQYFLALFDSSNSNEKNEFTNFLKSVRETIKNFREKNTLSTNQINIFHKILNVIARLMPSFIVQKKTRTTFFQQFTPQIKMLAKLEAAIQCRSL